MRILFFYRTRPAAYSTWLQAFIRLVKARPIAYNNHLHLDFFHAMAKCADVFMYGPYVDEDCPDISLAKYDQRYTIEDLVSMCNPDIIIMGNKARMLNSPKCSVCYERANCTSCPEYDTWLPGGFAQFNQVAKVIIEVDYHYEKDETWYRQHNIDLILQRHYSQLSRQESIPMRWLPFAVNTEIFKPDSCRERINKICFLGSKKAAAYEIRREMCARLKKAGLLDDKGEAYGGRYVGYLQGYVSHLSGSSLYDLTVGKTLEIAASGSVLLTNTFTGIDKLFDTEKQCFMEYQPDGSDIVAVAGKILNDRLLAREISSNAVAYIGGNHTYAHRIKELLKILADLI